MTAEADLARVAEDWWHQLADERRVQIWRWITGGLDGAAHPPVAGQHELFPITREKVT